MLKQDNIKKNGAVFTPKYIVNYMTSFIDNSKSQKILEPSCGVGNIINNINKKHNITGLDINNEYIQECIIKYRKVKPNANFIVKNFIDFKSLEKYDYIIGNPPYVKIQNIDKNHLEIMKKEYPLYIYGNTNLYIYFIIKCIELLKEDGKLIFIIPNSWLYNKSYNVLKKFIFENRYLQLLIDFKTKQIFDNYLTYTCIIILTKQKNKFYYYSNDINTKLIKKYYINNTNLLKKNILNILQPKIGLMTLKDDVFIIKKYKINGNKLLFTKNNINYIIEKDACKKILKVSKNKIYMIIYPYQNGEINPKIIPNLEKIYPLTYKYLLEYKDILLQRENGNNKYKYFYEYGRTQALKINKSNRLFISTVIKNIKSSFIEKKIDLYYSGLWLSPKNKESKDNIKNILIKNENKILEQSTNKANNWYGLSVNSFNINY